MIEKRSPATLSETMDGLEHVTAPSRQEVLDQLERLVASTHFRNSKRYPALLRFIVDETVEGRADALKERTLGIQVFGRPPAYDSNADPVVRVSAGEIRKRIAQYYQSPEHRDELHFELPLGSYAPHFFWPSQPSSAHRELRSIGQAEELIIAPHSAAEDGEVRLAPVALVSSVKSSAQRTGYLHRKAAFALGIVLAMIIAGFAVNTVHRQQQSEPGVPLFWQPLLDSKQSALIVIGVHSFDRQGKDTSPASTASLPVEPQSMLSSMTQFDMVSISDLRGYSEILNLLTRHGHAYHIQGSSDTTLEQLRGGPIILIGGFNNIWTMRFTSKLRFRFERETSTINTIRDSQKPSSPWRFDAGQDALQSVNDYALVSSFFDPDIEQQVFLAAGIGRHGTEAAAEFLTSNNYLRSWMTTAHQTNHQNIEIVLSTQIIEGKHGPPHVIASAEW